MTTLLSNHRCEVSSPWQHQSTMATKPELVNAEKAKESFELIAGFQTLIIIYSGFCEAGKVETFYHPSRTFHNSFLESYRSYPVNVKICLLHTASL